jgi:dihydropteroate synthase
MKQMDLKTKNRSNLKSIALGSHNLSYQRQPLVMGILNLTSDSFYAESRTPDIATALSGALLMCTDGADIIDIGAESTRPGSKPVSVAEEQKRLLPILEAIRSEIDLPITVDTRHAATAKLALGLGVDGINDISAGSDPEMFPLCADKKCGLILMHMQNSPTDMQVAPSYSSVIDEVSVYLAHRASEAEKAGVSAEQIIVDPGIGFGKTLEHNLELMKNLKAVSERPILLGASRKSFISMIDNSETDNRLGGSLAAVGTAYHSEAAIVRVHDVQETVQFLNVLSSIKG